MAQETSVAALLAERDRLRAALEPFAFAYLTYTTSDPARKLISVRNDGSDDHHITVETLARAWEAYRAAGLCPKL